MDYFAPWKKSKGAYCGAACKCALKGSTALPLPVCVRRNTITHFMARRGKRKRNKEGAKLCGFAYYHTKPQKAESAHWYWRFHALRLLNTQRKARYLGRAGFSPAGYGALACKSARGKFLWKRTLAKEKWHAAKRCVSLIGNRGMNIGKQGKGAMAVDAGWRNPSVSCSVCRQWCVAKCGDFSHVKQDWLQSGSLRFIISWV